MHAPGETEDQLLVWLPDQKVLLPGDNIYKAFPNLYTIRGTAFRDPTDWVKSLDKMRYLQPEFLVPSHTAPLQGANKIQAVLTDYRDAIQYLHDQTVRGMNLGKTADEIVEEMMLPTHLRQSEYLKEFYGDINLCVRSIFNGYLGPFDGNPTNLTSLTGRQRAGRMARLVGGQDVLKTKLSEAIAEEEYQWALELSDHLKWLTPDDETVTQLRITALENLAANTINPNLRHYYLSVASELNGTPNTPFNGPTIELAHEVTLDTIFRVMPTTLVASKAQKLDQLVIFEFPDVNQTYSVHIRHGIAEIQPFALPNPHNTVTMDSLVFKEIVAQLRNPMKTLSAGEMQITGSSLDLAYFMQLFKPIE
jgi:alkyl sulfatase BDS1-like metallo-beta-lactamase superfamily hydrolase